MSNVINAVVNNLSDRLGEVIEAVKPILQSVGSISQTVVKETSSAGFVYSMVGIGICCLSVLCVVFIVWVYKCVENKEDRSGMSCLACIFAVFFAVVGFSVTLSSLNDWVAPTKEVIRELITKI